MKPKVLLYVFIVLCLTIILPESVLSNSSSKFVGSLIINPAHVLTAYAEGDGSDQPQFALNIPEGAAFIITDVVYNTPGSISIYSDGNFNFKFTGSTGANETTFQDIHFSLGLKLSSGVDGSDITVKGSDNYYIIITGHYVLE